MRLIASNAGVEGDVIIEKLLGKAFEIGYNAVETPDHFRSFAVALSHFSTVFLGRCYLVRSCPQ